MLGSETLEVGIGLAFLFALLSLVATSLREFIETFLQMRALMLERGLRELLDDTDGKQTVKHLFDHPLLNGLMRGKYSGELVTPRLPWNKNKGKRAPLGSNLPAYIPARNFALALMDFAGADGKDSGSDSSVPLTVERLRHGISQIPNDKVRRALNTAVDHAHGNLDQVRLNLENWFDSGMDRVSGWYRKHTQLVLFGIGFVLAVGMNVNTIQVARELQSNGAVRAVIVAEAEAVTERTQKAAEGEGADAGAGAGAVDFNAQLGCKGELPEGKTCAQQRIESIPFPIGWAAAPIWVFGSWDNWFVNPKFDFWTWLTNMAGWLLTAVAISLGAPFWFDLLNKFMVIRSTVKPHEKSPEESSEDRQRSKRSQVAPPPPPPPPPAPPAAPLDPNVDPTFTPHAWAGDGDPQEGNV